MTGLIAHYKYSTQQVKEREMLDTCGVSLQVRFDVPKDLAEEKISEEH